MATKQHEHHGHDEAVSSPFHQHAFIIAGTRTLFLCHMTNTWMPGHRYQVVLRVGFPDVVREDYLDDRRRHPGEWHIVGNVRDDMFRVADLQRGARRSFIGSIWRGFPKTPGEPHWPWANEPPVVADFEVSVERVVYFRHFDFTLPRPPVLSYLLFGAGSEAHLHNYQVKSPEFDQVLTLAQSPAWLPRDLLEAGVPISFPDIPAAPSGGVYCSSPVADGSHSVQFAGIGPRRTITVDRSVWFGTFPVNNPDPCAGADGEA